MEKKITILALLMYLVFDCIAQVGNHYQFKGPKDEHFRAATREINGFYYAVGNTNSYNQINKILLCKLNTNGTLVWSKVIAAPNTQTNLVYSASDIQAGYSNPVPSDDTSIDTAMSTVTTVESQNSFDYLYISGTVFNPDSGTENMLLIKVAGDGSVIWAKSNFLPPTGVAAEYGVSVESVPDGGAFLVGKAILSNGSTAVSIVRFNDKGVLRWHNRYAKLGITQGDFTPQQSCLFREPYNFSVGIAVTGSYKSPSSTSTLQPFMMRVAHGGNELWRNAYPSGVIENGKALSEQGNDIIIDPITAGNVAINFAVAGNIGSSYVYMLRATTSGAFTNGFKINPPYSQGRISAISLLPTYSNQLAVSGIYDDNTFNKRTYLMQVSQLNGAVSLFNAYGETEPLGNEHIATRGTGYILATTQFGTSQDAMAITVDASGQENPFCRPLGYTSTNSNVGSAVILDTMRSLYNTNVSVFPDTQIVAEPADTCIYHEPPPFGCSQCLDSFRYNVCCCLDSNKIIYSACFRFDTTLCWNKMEWKITVDFGDNTSQELFKADSVCHIYAQPGTYKVCYTLQGLFFNGISWHSCSSQYCQTIHIYPCSTSTNKCTSPMCVVPPPFDEQKHSTNVIQVNNEIADITIYPNPLSEKEKAILSFELLADENLIVQIYELDGKLLSSEKYDYRKGKHTLPIITERLVKGFYLVKVTANTQSKALKLLVE